MFFSLFKRSRCAAAPTKEEKRLKIKPRLETMRKINQDLNILVKRSIRGLSL
jgi:hypothetical protein